MRLPDGVCLAKRCVSGTPGLSRILLLRFQFAPGQLSAPLGSPGPHLQKHNSLIGTAWKPGAS